jgi:hypothetical protein
MGEIDRQRISAVKKLHELGLAWHEGTWRKTGGTELIAEADAMHALLVRRADNLEGCANGSPDQAELASIVYAIEAYEEKRWPLGKVPGGKG